MTKHRPCVGSCPSQNSTVEKKLGQTHFESNGIANPKWSHRWATGQRGRNRRAVMGRACMPAGLSAQTYWVGIFPYRSCRKAMQTQQNKHSLPSPPVAFYRKMLKAVASGIIDSPWIPSTSETQGAEMFCRNRNRYIYTRGDAS